MIVSVSRATDARLKYASFPSGDSVIANSGSAVEITPRANSSGVAPLEWSTVRCAPAAQENPATTPSSAATTPRARVHEARADCCALRAWSSVIGVPLVVW